MTNNTIDERFIGGGDYLATTDATHSKALLQPSIDAGMPKSTSDKANLSPHSPEISKAS